MTANGILLYPKIKVLLSHHQEASSYSRWGLTQTHKWTMCRSNYILISCVWVCVAVCLSVCLCMCVCVYICVFAYICVSVSLLFDFFFSRETERKVIELSGWWSRKDLGGVGRGENMIRIYCIKLFSIKLYILNYFEKKGSQEIWPIPIGDFWKQPIIKIWLFFQRDPLCILYTRGSCSRVTETGRLSPQALHLIAHCYTLWSNVYHISIMGLIE